MKLIHDPFDDIWVWVEDFNENIELSPRYDLELSALAWRKSIAKELDNDLHKLYNGDNVVLPRTRDHAESMIRVASFYLDQYNEPKN